MYVLVIGGTGFIGSHVVRRLVDLGHDVTVLHRGEREVEVPPSIRHVHCDIAALAENHGLNADVVVHGYAMMEKDAQTATRLFRGRAAKIVVLSSGDVYRAYSVLRGDDGEIEPTPLREDAPLRTRLHPYGGDYEKILVERVFLSAPDLPVCVLRLPAVFGPGDRSHRFLSWVKRMDDGRRAILLGDSMARWRWTHGYVENVAAAIALAASEPGINNGVFNLGETSTPSMRERLVAYARGCRWRGDIVTVPESELPALLRTQYNFRQHMEMDCGRFRSQFGFTDVVDEQTAIARTIEWERSAPPENSALQQALYQAEDGVLSRYRSA